MTKDRLEGIRSWVKQMPKLWGFHEGIVMIGDSQVINDSMIDREIAVFIGDSKGIIEDLIDEVDRLHGLLIAELHKRR